MDRVIDIAMAVGGAAYVFMGVTCLALGLKPDRLTTGGGMIIAGIALMIWSRKEW